MKIAKNLVRTIVSMLVIVINIVLIPGSASAQNANPSGLTISPPLLELNIKPGQTYQERITLSNPSENVVEVYPVTMNFRSDGTGGQPTFYSSTKGDEKFGMASWISVTQPKIALAPQQLINFDYEINVPQDAEPGGHYGVLFFSTEPPQTANQDSNVAISSMIGCLILAKTEGATIEKAAIQNLQYKRIIFAGPFDLKTTIANLGNVHIKPVGEINIKGWRNESGTLTLNSERGNILPESSRDFNNSWQYSKFSFGRYEAQIGIVYGQGQTLTRNLTFWIIPWWLIIAVAAVLLAVLLAITINRKRKKRHFHKFFKVPE